MNKIYLMTEGEKVVLIHNMPFDSVNGLGKTEAELLLKGGFVDVVPEAPYVSGKRAMLMYNRTNGAWYSMVDLTDDEIEQRNRMRY